MKDPFHGYCKSTVHPLVWLWHALHVWHRGWAAPSFSSLFSFCLFATDSALELTCYVFFFQALHHILWWHWCHHHCHFLLFSSALLILQRNKHIITAFPFLLSHHLLPLIDTIIAASSFHHHFLLLVDTLSATSSFHQHFLLHPLSVSMVTPCPYKLVVFRDLHILNVISNLLILFSPHFHHLFLQGSWNNTNVTFSPIFYLLILSLSL